MSWFRHFKPTPNRSTKPQPGPHALSARLSSSHNPALLALTTPLEASESERKHQFYTALAVAVLEVHLMLGLFVLGLVVSYLSNKNRPTAGLGLSTSIVRVSISGNTHETDL